MSVLIDRVGFESQYTKILSRAKNAKNGESRWHYLCKSCGGTNASLYRDIAKSKSCRSCADGRRREDLTGVTFSSNTVTKYIGIGPAGTMYSLVCNKCGLKKTRSRTTILESIKSKNNHCKGCVENRRNDQSVVGFKRLDNIDKDRRRAILKRLYSAKKFQSRNRVAPTDQFISFDTFSRLATSDCIYCGAAPSIKKFDQVHTTSALHTDEAVLVGTIDRLDSNCGYEPGNCVASCKSCNSRKGKKYLLNFLWHTLERTGDANSL